MVEGTSAGTDTERNLEPQTMIEPFAARLAREGLELTRERTAVLQFNVGLLCNQVCKHCHLEAGPTRKEIMNQATADTVIAFAERCRFDVIDITGGAPELNQHLPDLLEALAPLAPRLMLRSNLTAMMAGDHRALLGLCRDLQVVLIASMPSVNAKQADAQRGEGVFDRSIEALRIYNSFGYGRQGSGLELDLVSSAVGAFLPASQDPTEKRYRREFARKWGITFNHLYSFANAPLGRFRKWLLASGNYDSYMERLASNFNPCTIPGLMCRNLISVDWNGIVYDCDFNLSGNLPLGGRRVHVSELNTPPPAGTPVAVGDHCYACTAGAGFT